MITLPALPPTRTLVISGFAALGVLLVAIGGWFWYDSQQSQALAAHAEVMARVQAAQAPEATGEVRLTAVRDLEALLARYPSARTVPEAAYALGNLRFATAQYPGARSAYEIVLQRGGPGMIRSLTRSGIARTWEAERDFARAADAYAALVKELDQRSFLYEDALVDQARALELAGKKDEAIAAYQRVLKEIPTARRADDVRSRLASLGTAAR